jgi:hypothetical protein
MQGLQLPNVLVADRSGVSIVLMLVGAMICAVGVVRGCSLATEMSHLDAHPPTPVPLRTWDEGRRLEMADGHPAPAERGAPPLSR